MKPLSNLKYFFLSSFSNPAYDRGLYRAIKKIKASSIIEIGVGNASRSGRMIQVAKKFSGSGNVRYTGIDVFESAEAGQITLKQCHQKLNAYGVKLQLVPGDVHSSLHRIANSHTRTDLLVVSAPYEESSLEDAWFYVPRMLHATSLVFLQESNDSEAPFKKLTRLEIERKVKKQPRSTTRAA